MISKHESASDAAAQSLLQRLPESLYRSLTSPFLTTSTCADTLTRAVRARNPRVIREWIDHERNGTASATILRVLDAAIEHYGLPKDADHELVTAIRSEADSYLVAEPEKPNAGVAADICKGILLAIKSVNPTIYQHSLAVEQLAIRLARATKTAGIDLERLSLAAQIHEMGRLRVLVESQDAFSSAQRHEFRTLLANLPIGQDDILLLPIADIVYDMYLAPLLTASNEALVLRAADAMIALCEPRAYRPAMRPSEALRTLENDSEHRFHPAHIRALSELMGARKPVAA